MLHVRQEPPPASTPHAGEYVEVTVLLSTSAWSTPDGLSFIGSLLAAASGATLASSSPAWGNISPGPSSSSPRFLTRSGNRVFLSADDGWRGVELWSLPWRAVTGPLSPHLTCPAEVSVQTSSATGVSVNLPEASALDDTAPPEVTYSPASGSTFPVGDTEVTVTARDEEGLTATCTFRVTVALTVEPPDAGTEAPDAGIEAPDAGEPVPVQEHGSGCGCAAGSSPVSAGWGALMLLGWVAARRRSVREREPVRKA